MKIFFQSLVVLGSVYLLSCDGTDETKKTDGEWAETVKQTVKDYVGKPIKLPKEKLVINDSLIKSENNGKYSVKSKIVIFVDANCGACLSNFSFWMRFNERLKKRQIHCPIEIYVQVEDANQLKLSVLNKYNITIPCFLDQKAQFVSLNGLYDARFQAALLDEKNRVVIIGNPMLNPKLEELYFDTLNHL